jgi:putative addiction module component (TIGR02574 family)
MNPLLEQLKNTVSALPDADRVELAHYILASLEPEDDGLEEAWREELDRRMSDIRAGRVVGRPVEDVIARLREQYP